jgi:hypothetical protein
MNVVCAQSSLTILHLLGKALGWLEARHVVGFDRDGGIFLDVAGRLGGAVLDDETSEAPEIDILMLINQAVFHGFHKTLDDDGNVLSLQAGHEGYLVDNLCFSHFFDGFYRVVYEYVSFWECKGTKVLRDTKIYLTFFAKKCGEVANFQSIRGKKEGNTRFVYLLLSIFQSIA